MSATLNSLTWFARHDLRLVWRDWVQLMSGGRKLKDVSIVIGMIVFALAMHGLAYAILEPYFSDRVSANRAIITLIVVAASMALSLTMMLAQSLEQVTRAFYTRDDLDLILSSPASARSLFSVRITIMMLTTALMSGLMIAPFINMTAVLGGAHWLAAYAVMLAIAAVATALAVMLTLFLFQTAGAKRTRLIAQILAAIVGASFIIGIQVAAIVSYGSMSRWDVLGSQSVANAMPSPDSVWWFPAQAAMGTWDALCVVMAASTVIFLAALRYGAARFEKTVLLASSVTIDRVDQSGRVGEFVLRSPFHALVHKEWMLLSRDPWLVSQSLMQLLYLIPPALMLWMNFGGAIAMPAVLASVIVMAVGQLAGGLSWLTISGEDAPDLVATVPVKSSVMIVAKISAVFFLIGALIAPFTVAMAFFSYKAAAATFFGALLAAGSAILIQWWFRGQSKRNNLRRRQVASKVSTFCEAFASIGCAATACVAAMGSLAAIVPAVMVIIVLTVAWLYSPRQA